MPADFFRTMEDASGVDLDWFWRGRFYTTEHTHIAIEGVRLFNIDTKNPDVEKTVANQQRAAQPETLSAQRKMPVIFQIEYADGSKEEMRIPAESWRRNNIAVSK